MKRPIDYTLLFIILGLMVFGMIMISSVSVYPSFKVTTELVRKWLLVEANNYFYLVRNITHVAIATFVLVFFIKFPYQSLEKYAYHIFGASVIMLIAVLIVGRELNGAKWWIDIPGVPFSLQPVEFAKIGLIIFLAAFARKIRYKIHEFQAGFITFFSYAGVILALLMFQPDFGSILIIAPVVMAMYFIGWWNARYLIVSWVIALIWAAGVYSIGKIGAGESRNSLSYISDRIDNFLRNNKDAIKDDTINYQTKQWLLAIGSGGFSGLWFGQSIQKFWYLPEVQWDFIFSVIVEELGFMGAFAIVLCYLVIVFRIYLIARHTKDIFAKYLVFGIGTLLVVQTYVNLWVNLNIVPLTGVTLPLISYGGSSLISFMMGFGIILNISRSIEKQHISFAESFSIKRKVMR